MDDPGLSARLHREALEQLDTLNRISFTAEQIWRELRRQFPQPRALTILDIASGSGSIAARLATLGRARGYDLAVDACDISDVAVAHAAQRHAGRLRRVFRLDAIKADIPNEYDVVTCSLFLHHLEAPAASALLRKMSVAARHLAIVSDLERTRTGYLLAFLATRLLSHSPIVRVDALRSIRNAYTREEVRQLAASAGLLNVRIERRFPCRLMIVSRSDGTGTVRVG